MTALAAVPTLPQPPGEPLLQAPDASASSFMAALMAAIGGQPVAAPAVLPATPSGTEATAAVTPSGGPATNAVAAQIAAAAAVPTGEPATEPDPADPSEAQPTTTVKAPLPAAATTIGQSLDAWAAVPSQPAAKVLPAATARPAPAARAKLPAPAATDPAVATAKAVVTDHAPVETKPDSQPAAAPTSNPPAAEAIVAAEPDEAETAAPGRENLAVAVAPLGPGPAHQAPPATSPAATPPAPAALPRETLPAVAASIVAGVARQHERLTLQLQPAELGRVDVALHVDGTGRLHAAFAVERPETLQLMQRDARGLEQMLSASGLQLAGSGLSFSLRRDGGQGGGADSAPRSFRPAGDESADRPAADMGGRGRPARSSLNLLDLSV